MDELIEEQLDKIGGDSEQNEWRIFGPPGTGKTWWASRQIERAVARFGREQVMACSFTKAAAVELGSRVMLDREQMGTLHAHAYRALGRPTIAETRHKDWNAEYPHMAISGGSEGRLDEPDTDEPRAYLGDEYLATVSLYRNLCMPFEYWPDAGAKRFYAMFWKPWKDAHGFLDFTDLLEHAASDIRIAPGNPRVLLVDEAQDCSRLQLKIIQQWGRHTDYYLTIGDDDQTLYVYIGATPDAFLTPPLAPERNIVLSQSHRVPQRIFNMADPWIRRILAAHRYPKVYRPTAEEGEVEWEDSVYRDGNGCRLEYDDLLDQVESDLAAGRTAMILASCSYLLSGVRAAIMCRGIPFHNPYRRRRGDWNPLHGHGVTAAQRVLEFLAPHWDREDSRPWNGLEHKHIAQWLMAEDTYRRGMKERAMNWPEDREVSEVEMREWYEPDALRTLIDALGKEPVGKALTWYITRLLKAHVKSAQYPAKIVADRGLAELQKQPGLVLGTIHSVKGGEADVVYLFPDLSPSAMKTWEVRDHSEARESIIRQFYVGLTRARQKLVMCEPVYGRMSVFTS